MYRSNANIPFDLFPLVAGFGAENLTEFLDGFILLRERCSLELTSVADTTPAIQQYVEVLALLIDHLINNSVDGVHTDPGKAHKHSLSTRRKTASNVTTKMTRI